MKEKGIAVLELLESRVLLSGTVQLQADHGRFFITGDDQPNQIAIYESNNIIHVGGLGGTKITGTPEHLHQKFSRGIVVNLNGGNDAVTFAGHLLGDLDIDTGDGNDLIIINNANVSNSMLLQAGAGDDGVSITNSSIRFNAQIEQGTGADFTVMNSFHVGNELKIDDLIGNAQMSLSRLIVGGDTIVKTGDTSDGVAIHHSVLNGDTAISTAGGNDSIFLSDTHLNGKVGIDPGTGTNHVQRDIFINSDFSHNSQNWVGEAAGLSAAADANVKINVHFVTAETGFQSKVLELASENPATLYLKRGLTAADGIIAGQAYNVQFTVNFLSNRPTSAARSRCSKSARLGT